MTLTELRAWLTTLADATATLPASEVLRRLPESEEQAEPANSAPTPNIELTWREKLWLVPAETRLGVAELCEALGRSTSWAYRRTGPKAEDPLPHRLLDGQLTFTAGELRTWVREHEESVHELPMDDGRSLKVVDAVGEAAKRSVLERDGEGWKTA